MAVHAQTPRELPVPMTSPTPSLERRFLQNILRDQKTIWTAPFHLGRSDAKWLIPTGIGAMALFTTDRITGDEIAKSHRQLKASRIVSRAGSVYGLASVATAFYLVGRKTHNARARETGLLSAEAFVDSLIVGSALKGITQRARPLAGGERSEFFDGGSSFPSGHSIQAWSVATVIAKEYHDRPLVQVAAYGLAGGISLARFTGSKHYLSDVLFGSALGYGIGQYVYRINHNNGTNAAEKASHWPSITPRYNRSTRQHGVALTWNF
jgi:membrane-associated phospholipid phosphatase